MVWSPASQKAPSSNSRAAHWISMKKRKQNKFVIRHSLYEIDNMVNYKRSILLAKIIQSRLLGIETCSYQWVVFSLQYLH